MRLRRRSYGSPAHWLVVFVVSLLPCCMSFAQRSKGMDANRAAMVKEASPLNHTVKIQRTGSYLKLDYSLVGTDGKTYDLWEINDQSKPVFSVYRGDEKVGGGDFEFG